MKKSSINKGELLIAITFILVVVMTLLTLYTLYIGTELLMCSELVRDAEENFGQPMVDKAFVEALKTRTSIREANFYSSWFYHLNAAIKVLVFLIEGFVTVWIFKFLVFLYEAKVQAERRRVTKHQKIQKHM